jgi:hypothetical protein
MENTRRLSDFGAIVLSRRSANLLQLASSSFIRIQGTGLSITARKTFGPYSYAPIRFIGFHLNTTAECERNAKHVTGRRFGSPEWVMRHP